MYDTSGLMLIVMSLTVLFIQVTNALGLWNVPWFKNSLVEINLAFLVVFAVVISTQQMVHRRQLEDVLSTLAYRSELLDKISSLGIENIWPEDRASMEKRRENMQYASSLSIITVSAFTWTKSNSDLIEKLLLERGCTVKLLLATPQSEFVRLREQREGEYRKDAISNEIEETIRLFRNITNTVVTSSHEVEKRYGMLEIRLCEGDMPARVEIINDSSFHYTPFILPAKSMNMPAFNVEGDRSRILAGLLKQYFNKLWDESNGNIQLKWPP